MHPHFLLLEPFLPLRHQRLLEEVASCRRVRLASAVRPVAPAPSSLRHQIASALRSLAAWLDGRTTFDPAASLPALA